MKKSRLIIGSLLALFFILILFYDNDNEYLQEKTANKIWYEFAKKTENIINKGDHLTYEAITNASDDVKWIKYKEQFSHQIDMLNVKNAPKMRNIYILQTKFADFDGKYNIRFSLLEKNTREQIGTWNIAGEPIRAKSLLPAIFGLVLLIFTMRPILSLFFAVWVGSTLNNANSPIIGLQQLIANYIPAGFMGDNLSNLKILLSLIVIQITISLLWRSAYVNSTKESGSNLVKLVTVPFLSVHPYLFSSMGAWFLNTLKFKKEKRHVSSFISQSLSLILPSLIFTPYIISVMDIISRQLLMINIDVRGIKLFLYILPFRFFSLSLIAIIIGTLIFKHKNLNLEPKNEQQDNVKTNKWLPLLIVFICPILLFLASLRFNDINTSLLLGTTGALILTIFVVIKTYILSWKELGKLILLSIKNNIKNITLLILSFAMVNILSDLGTVYYIVSIFKLNGSNALFPLFAFLISTITTLLMGNSMVTFMFITPVLIPVGGLLGGFTGIIMAVAGILEGGLAGEMMSPFSPTSIIVSNTYKTSPIKHVLHQAPYILVGIIATSIFGFFMTTTGIPLWINYLSIFLISIIGIIKRFPYKIMS
ncbi:MAG: Na+/H+ antiporter NhaC family protein [bacterium]